MVKLRSEKSLPLEDLQLTVVGNTLDIGHLNHGMPTGNTLQVTVVPNIVVLTNRIGPDNIVLQLKVYL